MAAKILIEDGNPWWTSPNIWVVPGDDPNGSPGMPIAGQQNYLWARVENTGDTIINGAQINFYWSNPATGVLRSNSTLIGFAFVDLEIGETKEVLCLTSWIPIIVNDGHECVLAEVITTLDPLPVPLPDAFDPRNFDQIAQRNLHVIQLNKLMINLMFFPIQISAPIRFDKEVVVRVDNTKLDKKQEREILRSYGIKELPKFNDKLVEFGLSDSKDCGLSKKIIGNYEFMASIKEGNSKAVYLHLRQNNKAKSGYQFINIIETVNGEIQGGNSFLIIKV